MAGLDTSTGKGAAARRGLSAPPPVVINSDAFDHRFDDTIAAGILEGAARAAHGAATSSNAASHMSTNTPGNGGTSSSPFDKPAPAGSAQTVSAVLGEIVWLMSQSPLHKQFFISDLEWLVMTPVILQQFRMYYQDAPPDQGGKRPIGVILWGSVNLEIEKALAQGITRMRPGDWKSGDRIWVVEIIAPFGGAEAMVADLKAKVFADRPVRFLTVKDGKKEVKAV